MNIAKIVREAREQSRLTALDFANGIFDEFIELHGDRSFRDDGAVIGGIGWLGEQAVTVVGIQKGKSDWGVTFAGVDAFLSEPYGPLPV